MIQLTRLHVALIATAASVLTSAMHATMQAIFALRYDSFGLVLGYVFGRVLGDVPIAILCFGTAYAVLKFSGVQSDGADSASPPSG